MKKLLYIMLCAAFCCTAFSCKKDGGIRSGHPERFTVYGTGYDSLVAFKDSAVIVSKLLVDTTTATGADTTVIVPVKGILTGVLHKYFKDHEFVMLTSPGRSNNGGYMVTDVDSPVYIIAPASPVPVGWSEVKNTSGEQALMYLNVRGNTITLKIFSTYAHKDKPVTIPAGLNAVCPTPLGKEIKYVNN